MAKLFTNLGTAELLRQLGNAEDSLKKYNDIPSPESEATALLEQIADVRATTASLDSLAASERRNPSVRLSLAGDGIQLRSICTSVASVIKQCGVSGGLAH